MTVPDRDPQRGEGAAWASDVVRFIGKVPIFHFLDPDELASLASRLGLKTYDAGQVIFDNGAPGTTLQIIASGSVKIYRPSEGEEETSLAMLEPGDYVGELSLLDGGPQTASAIALTQTSVLTLERDDFLSYITDNPQGMAAILGSLAALIRRQNTQLFGEFFGA